MLSFEATNLTLHKYWFFSSITFDMSSYVCDSVFVRDELLIGAAQIYESSSIHALTRTNKHAHTVRHIDTYTHVDTLAQTLTYLSLQIITTISKLITFLYDN
jgi:hypothetical protein